MQHIATVSDPGRARLLMHPLRRRIIAEAAEAAVSATQVAKATRQPRQKVNYHFTTLVAAGLLEPVGERQRRGLTEKLYRASARYYTLMPEVLGRLSPPTETDSDAFSAATVLAVAARTQTEVARAAEQAHTRRKRLATLSIDTLVRFTSADEQAQFAEALAQAVADITSRFAQPSTSRRGHRYRFVAAVYPVPASGSDT